MLCYFLWILGILLLGHAAVFSFNARTLQRICRSKVVQPLGIFLGAFVGRAAGWFIWTQAKMVWSCLGAFDHALDWYESSKWKICPSQSRVSGTGQSSSYVSWLWIRPGMEPGNIQKKLCNVKISRKILKTNIAAYNQFPTLFHLFSA